MEPGGLLCHMASPGAAASAAWFIAPSDGSSDSVAFAGISLTRTVPSSSPRPAPVTDSGCPQYPALRRRMTRCSRSQLGPDVFRTDREITSPLLTREGVLESRAPEP